MKNIWFGVIVFVLVVLSVVYFNNNYVQPTGSFLKPVNLPQEISKISEGQIIFAKKINQNTLIQSIDSSGEVKTLFTDQDEVEKIVRLGQLNLKTMELPAIVGKSTLIKIKLDGSAAKTVLSKDFSFTEFTFNPIGDEVAYITFSNAEREYGYSIVTANLGGEEKKLYQSENKLSNLKWMASGIGFNEEATEESSAKIINTLDKGLATVYITKNNLYDINFADNLVIDKISDRNSAKLGLIQSKQIKVIYESKTNLLAYPIKSSSTDKIVFLANNKDGQENGIIYTIDVNGKNIQKIEQGIKILAWI